MKSLPCNVPSTKVFVAVRSILVAAKSFFVFVTVAVVPETETSEV